MNMPIHSFHIPVMGTSFTLDSPLKIAKYGISSVISIGDDDLLEKTRLHYAQKLNKPVDPIPRSHINYRELRIKAFLNLVNQIVQEQTEVLRKQPFTPDSEIARYFELLQDSSPYKQLYLDMLNASDTAQKEALQNQLRQGVCSGNIDVNIMTKIDRDNYDPQGQKLPPEFSDALSVFKGFALSNLRSSIVFSAGFNRRLYSYVSEFDDFYPDENGELKKKVVLKVSDFRSSMTQGKFLTKKGIWISEFRIESGLNCGGHAFGKDGYLLGPILEEFKTRKQEMQEQFYQWAKEAIEVKGRKPFKTPPTFKITVQGGIGTPNENAFLFDYFKVDGTGWATPFLLVPEVSALDSETIDLLINAQTKDLYLSNVSPMGIPFNTVRGTASEKLRFDRISKGNPGSPCPKGHLGLFNTEFSEKPICVASANYQSKKIRALKEEGLTESEFESMFNEVVEKSCLCEDLAAPGLIVNEIPSKRPLNPIVCPGPNIAFFNRKYSLTEMVGHIYGKWNLISGTTRSNMFVNELKIYIQYLSAEIQKALPAPSQRQLDTLNEIGINLTAGIEYIRNLIPNLVTETQQYQDKMKSELLALKQELDSILEQHQVIFSPQKANAVSA